MYLASLKILLIFTEMRLKKKCTRNKSHPFTQMQKTGGEKNTRKGKADSAKYFRRSDVVTKNLEPKNSNGGMRNPC